MTVLTDWRAAMGRHRGTAEITALLAFACVVFGALGMAARSRLEATRIEQLRATSAVEEMTRFRSASRDGAADESARLRLPDSLALAVPQDVRVGVAEHVATLAEAAGLKNVRVWFVAGADSAAPPPRPDLVEVPVAIANYTVAVECDGSYASLLALIRELPPSLAFQRLNASGTASAGPRFHMTLAVFDAETAAAPTDAARHG